MSKHKLEMVHMHIGMFQGGAGFLLDGRLIHFQFGTPNFNDYNEWRLNDIKFSNLPYDPSQNDIELTPVDNFKTIELTDRELEWLGHFFSFEANEGFEEDKDADAFDAISNQILEKYPNSCNPWDYLGEERPLTSCTYSDNPNELTHFIYDEVNIDKDDNPVFRCVDKVITSEWKPKGDITLHHGIYDLIIPIMEQVKEIYYSE